MCECMSKLYHLSACGSPREGRTAPRMNLSRSMMSGGEPPAPDHEPDDERADMRPSYLQHNATPLTLHRACNSQSPVKIIIHNQ